MPGGGVTRSRSGCLVTRGRGTQSSSMTPVALPWRRRRASATPRPFSAAWRRSRATPASRASCSCWLTRESTGPLSGRPGISSAPPSRSRPPRPGLPSAGVTIRAAAPCSSPDRHRAVADADFSRLVPTTDLLTGGASSWADPGWVTPGRGHGPIAVGPPLDAHTSEQGLTFPNGPRLATLRCSWRSIGHTVLHLATVPGLPAPARAHPGHEPRLVGHEPWLVGERGAGSDSARTHDTQATPAIRPPGFRDLWH